MKMAPIARIVLLQQQQQQHHQPLLALELRLLQLSLSSRS